MAELWYYTSEGKQMDAVSMKELKRLVGDGALKPTDMVWKEGMARWIRASSVKELFPDPGAVLDKYFSSSGQAEKQSPQTTSVVAGNSAAAPTAPTSATSEKSEAQKKKKSKSSGDDEEEDNRRPPRRRAEASGGGGGGTLVIIVLIAGGAVLLLTLVIGVIILLFTFAPAGGGKAGGDVVQNNKDAALKDANKGGGNPLPGQDINGEVRYNATLQPAGKDSRTFKFKKGQNYQLQVRSEPRFVDVDLYILNMNNGQEAADSSVGPDSNLTWSPPNDGEYRIEVRNLDGGANVQSAVTIRETDPPPPAGVRVGSGTATSKKDLKTGGTFMVKLRIKGGYPAKLTSPTPGVSFTVVKDSDPTQQIAAQAASNATLNLSVPTTEIVQVRLRNEGKTPAAMSLVYDVSP